MALMPNDTSGMAILVPVACRKYSLTLLVIKLIVMENGYQYNFSGNTYY
jgi:hypothetical protein